MSSISSMNVRTNISTQQAHRYARETSSAKSNAARRLSSGKRITSAADDAAGAAIVETMTAQIRGLDQASTNASDAIGLIQTAEGAMGGVGDKLHRVRELLVQAANDTYVHHTDDSLDMQFASSNRDAIHAEIQSLLDEINSISHRAEFNTRPLLSGAFDTDPPAVPPPAGYTHPTHEGELWMQIGANSGQGMTVPIPGVSTTLLAHAAMEAMEARNPGSWSDLPTNNPTVHIDLKYNLDVRFASGEHISALIEAADAALNFVSNARANLGSMQNRLEYTMRSLDNTSINLQDARSRIRDADMAKEMMDFMQMQVLFNTGSAMMAQGNQLPQTVLQLLDM